MDLKLENARALVTGASRGLGFATAKGLALEGCQVAIASRDEGKIKAAAEQIHQETNQTCHPIPGDVADPETPAKIVEQAAAAMGGLDLLVTNAGGPPSGPFDSQDEAAWENAINLSFMSHVRLIQAALPHLRKSKIASVLTVTSITVKQPIPNLVLSNSIRAATAGLTKSLALELGEEGIRFNSILPGTIATERNIELMTSRSEKSGRTIEEENQLQAAKSPLGRIGTAEEFAYAAVFLLSPAASFITGAMLGVDGGMYKATF